MLSIRIDNGALVAGKVRVISTFWQRHWPFDRHYLSDDQGLLLNPGGSIHSFGMPCASDAVFLDRGWRILKLVPSMRPCRWVWAPRAATLVLLLADGRACSAGLSIGMSLAQDTSTARVAQPFATTVLRRAASNRGAREPGN